MSMARITRALLIACGTACVALGVIGIFLPLLPTTPFLLLAAFCYARSSERFYRRLVANRWLGGYIRRYHSGQGPTRKQRTIAIIAVWLSIGFTTLFVVPLWWCRAALLLVATGVSVYLVRLGR